MTKNGASSFERSGVSAIVVGVIACLMTLAPEAASARGQAHNVRGLDYSGAPGQLSSGARSAKSADQCRLSVAKRVGPWMCSTPQNGLSPRPSWAPRPSMNPFTTTGFCASDGCYYRYSDFTADFDSYTGFWAPGPRSWAVRPTTSTGR